MYDLAIHGFAAFARQDTLLGSRRIPRDPLVGIVDGVNRTFYASYFPLLTSGSAGVTVGGSGSSALVDYETGEFILTAAPAAQPIASYTFTPYTPGQILAFVISGFEEMETRWTRGWRLVDELGAPADETSAHLYVVDSSGSDPMCGPVAFSASPVQRAVLHLCNQMVFLRAQFHEAAIGDYSYTESRGMKIDKGMRPRNLEAAVKALDDRITAAILQAQDAFYPGGEHYGGYASGPHTDTYWEHFEWQAVARLDNLTGYHVPRRWIYP